MLRYIEWGDGHGINVDGSMVGRSVINKSTIWKLLLVIVGHHFHHQQHRRRHCHQNRHRHRRGHRHQTRPCIITISLFYLSSSLTSLYYSYVMLYLLIYLYITFVQCRGFIFLSNRTRSGVRLTFNIELLVNITCLKTIHTMKAL